MPPCGAATRGGITARSTACCPQASPCARAGGQGSAARLGGPLLPPARAHTPCISQRPPSSPTAGQGRASPAPATPAEPHRHSRATARTRSAAGRTARPGPAHHAVNARTALSRPGVSAPCSVRVSSPRGEISRVLGRRSAPRSGSNCGPCVRQPSSRRVMGRRAGSSRDT